MKRKIKVRDLTKEQWDNFLHKCHMTCSKCPFNQARCLKSENERSWFTNKNMFSDKFLNQEVEIDAPDILDEVEKKYLSNIIKPFRDRVIYIKKVKSYYNDAYFISIHTKSKYIPEGESLCFPFFKNEMYVGMKENEEYTLEELGL